MKLREILLEQQKKAKELAVEVGTDEPMISKIINYKCLPVPLMMLAICKSLNCKVEDIYEDDEVYYKTSERPHKASAEISAKTTSKQTKELNSYNLCVKLPNEARNTLARENLRKVGYKDLTQWIWKCYRDLLNEIKKTDSKVDLESGQAN